MSEYHLYVVEWVTPDDKTHRDFFEYRDEANTLHADLKKMGLKPRDVWEM